MEEKANTGQVIIVLTEHLTFGTLLIPYMAEKSDDGTYQLIEQAFHASPEAISRMNKRIRTPSLISASSSISNTCSFFISSSSPEKISCKN